MDNFCCSIKEKEVYPIVIKFNNKRYLTLYYYTEPSDSLLHKNSKSILCFHSIDDMNKFCQKNGSIKKGDTEDDEIFEYDFDEPIKNPLNYSEILDKWNLLNTIANIFGMFFEGDLRKYNAVYNFLFRLSTPIEPIPPTLFINKKYLEKILKVFRKRSRFLNNFEFYVD